MTSVVANGRMFGTTGRVGGHCGAGTAPLTRGNDATGQSFSRRLPCGYETNIRETCAATVHPRHGEARFPGGNQARLSQRLGMLASFVLFVDFRRCRMTGLPMLTVRRGSEGTEPKPPKHNTSAPTQMFEPDRQRPTPARWTETQSVRQEQGAQAASCGSSPPMLRHRHQARVLESLR
jgi:hypothetical protein